jgi:uncharacterized protein YjlB
MNRRQFSTAMAALGLTVTSSVGQALHIDRLQLSCNGWMPNNDRLPVLLYRRAFSLSGDIANVMERAFATNAWPPQWRNGVYDFHHFHSTAHEVLGFAAGSAQIILGGEGGHTVAVNTGDVAVLPAGTGHCRLSATSDFLVIGAYPANQHWDICRTAPDAATLERMRALPFPPSDPVTGRGGALTDAWRL